MKKFFLVAGIFALMSITTLNAQVTIGINSTPLKGTLLELKESDVADDGANSTKGMMYPRVALSDPNNLAPMLEGTDLTDANKLQYAGLTVYNVTEDVNFQKGLYVWDGAKWNLTQSGGQSALTTVLDAAGDGLSIANDSVILGGSLDRNTVVDLNSNNLAFSNTGNVGIGTATPTVKLDVVGKSNVSSTLTVGDTLTSNKATVLKSVPPSDGMPLAQIGVDTSTGQVFTVGTANSSTPFNYVTYKITITGGQGDWVQWYDTKIPASDYTLVVVGSSFTPPTGGLVMTDPGDFAAKQVYAQKSTSTTNPVSWQLVADFAGASTAGSPARSGGIWTINCIAINNSVVKTLNNGNPITVSMSSTTGTASSMPSGL